MRERYDVINLSLSTTNAEWGAGLHELADQGFFQRSLIVASAHNMPVDSYPWRFSSVISVGSHDQPDPLVWYANPEPPVELFARGVDVEVAWEGGGDDHCHRQQLRDAAHRGDLRADPRQAPHACARAP